MRVQGFFSWVYEFVRLPPTSINVVPTHGLDAVIDAIDGKLSEIISECDVVRSTSEIFCALNVNWNLQSLPGKSADIAPETTLVRQ